MSDPERYFIGSDTLDKLIDTDWFLASPDTIEDIRMALLELRDAQAAIRHHHAQRGNDKCWENDNELYAKFGLEPHNKNQLVSYEEHCRNCQKYRDEIYGLAGEMEACDG